jgi:hypothetical protein
MTEKFKVGDRVYDILKGIGTIKRNPDCGVYTWVVIFPLASARTYTEQGFLTEYDVNPALLTLTEARAKGYDVPKEKVTHKDVGYRKILEDGTLSRCWRSAENLVALGIDPTDRTNYAEVVTTWEEEI